MEIRNDRVNQHFAEVIRHLYISPLEMCNLRCQICYTNKTKARLSREQIELFIDRYAETVDLQSVIFCGGEVFILPYLPKLINSLNQKSIYVQVITNGTIDRLEEINNPGMVNLIVSLDGMPKYHDSNRGTGNWTKSINFLKRALKLGFKAEVFSIVTVENETEVDKFEAKLEKTLGEKMAITYHPRKPFNYLNQHPTANRRGVMEGFGIPEPDCRQRLAKNRAVFPPLNLGCFQISLMSDGKVYGCCEGIKPLGGIDDKVEELLDKLNKRLNDWGDISKGSMGCAELNFVCGLKDEYVA